jgi:Bacterial membrane protein YfhO
LTSISYPTDKGQVNPASSKIGLVSIRRIYQHPDVQAVVLLAALTFIFLVPAATLRGVYFYGSASDFFARLAYTAERLHAGGLPLWNPYLSLGGTQAGDPRALTWYLPALALFQILPQAVSFNYTIILHFFLGAMGMYFLARAWGLRRGSALLSAIVFGFGGFLVAHLQELNIVVAVVWLPWIFACLEKFFTARRALYLGLGALALGLQLLGGQSQIVLCGACAWIAYCAVWLVREWRAGERRTLEVQLVGLVVMTLAGAGIAAIFLAPYLELVQFIAPTARVSYDSITALSLDPSRLIAFVYPYFFGGNAGSVERGAGNLLEMTGYVGIFPLVLSAFAVTRREWHVQFLIGLAVAAFLLALGKFTPLYLLVYRLPAFGDMDAPARFLELVVFALALLAGFGPEQLRGYKTSRIGIVILGALAVLLVGLAALAIAPHLGIKFGDVLGQAATNRALLFSGGFVAGSIVLLILWARKNFPERVLLILTLAFVFADLFAFGMSFQYNGLVTPAVYSIPGKSTRVIERDHGQFNSYYSGAGQPAPATLMQNGRFDLYFAFSRAGVWSSLPMLFQIHSMQGYGSEPPAYHDLIARIEQPGHFNDRAAQWLGNYGALDLLSETKLKLPVLQLIQRNGNVSFLRLTRGFGRAALISNAESVNSPAEALHVLDTGTLPSSSLALEAPNVGSNPPTTGSVSLERDDPEHVTIAVESNSAPAYLLLNDTYYPGWSAFVDGQPAPLYRANGLVRAVPVAAGSHLVEFVYDPLSVKIGALISGISLLLVLGWIGFDIWQGRRRGEGREQL